MFLYIKHSKDKEVLEHILSTDTRFKAIEREAAVLINTVTGSNLPLDTTLEVTDMCKAINDIREDARLEGHLEGRLEGYLQMLKNATVNLHCSIKEAMDILGVPASDRDVLAAKMNQ